MTAENVVDIVREYLKAHGYDGLVEHMGACACGVDDLAPCDAMQGDCEPGTRVDGCNDDCGEGCDFHIVKGKPRQVQP